MPEESQEKGMMPGEKSFGRPHHPEAKPTMGLPGQPEKGERYFATLNEFREALEGIPDGFKKKANRLRRNLRSAIKKSEEEKVGDILKEVDGLVEKEPKLVQWSELMEQEATGEVQPGESSEKSVGEIVEEPPQKAKPEDIRMVPDAISDERMEDDEEVLVDPRTEKMKFVERYPLWVEETTRSVAEIRGQYFRFLAGIGARQPVPGQGINDSEWEEIARYTAEIDSIIRKIGRKERGERTAEEKGELKRAQKLKRMAGAYYHELEFYHRFWYGEESGIGKEVKRSKEGSRLLLIDQMAVLFTIPEVAKAFKEEKGYKSDAELVDEVNDPYGWRRLGHHLRRYSCTPMYRDAYEAGAKTAKPGEPIKPGFGLSYEYSLFGIYFTGRWAEKNNAKYAKVLRVEDADGNLIIDLGKLGATYDMWTTPARLELYVLFWEHLGKRNQIRLSAGRGREWLNKHEEQLYSKKASEGLRDLLWNYRDKEKVLRDRIGEIDKKKESEGLSAEDEEELQQLQSSLQDLLAEQERLVGFSNEEIKEFRELLMKKAINREQLREDEEESLAELKKTIGNVMLRNMINRDLGFDPSERDFNLIAIFSDPLSRHEELTPNDILTNLLVDVRRMEQTQDALTAGKECFIAKPSFEMILDMESEVYAHLGYFPWLRERQIFALRELVSRLYLAGVINTIRLSGTHLFEEESKKIYDSLKAKANVGLHAEGLKATYGIDFTDPDLKDGASLAEVIRCLKLVHRGRLNAIYEQRREQWVINVLEKGVAAEAHEKVRFLSRFRFSDYVSFEARIIEEPVLNAMGWTREESLEKEKERFRTRDLWLAKKGQLPGDDGVFIFSRNQALKPGWERFAREKGESDRRKEDGRWIYGYRYETDKFEKVGYVTDENHVYRTIAWEDPIQKSLFEVEQLIYSKNYEILSKYIDEHSPEIIDDPNEWLTPPQRQNLIKDHLRRISIDPDRAEVLMKKYSCTNADCWIWTAKRLTFGRLAPELIAKIPIVGPLARNVNIAGIGLSGWIGAVAQFGLPRVATYLTGNPIAIGTGVYFLQLGLISFVTSPLVRRMAWLSTIPGTNFRLKGLLPIYWEPKGKVKEYEG